MPTDRRADLVVRPTAVLFRSHIKTVQPFECCAMIFAKLPARSPRGAARAAADSGRDHEPGRNEPDDHEREAGLLRATRQSGSRSRRPAVAQLVDRLVLRQRAAERYRRARHLHVARGSHVLKPLSRLPRVIADAQRLDRQRRRVCPIRGQLIAQPMTRAARGVGRGSSVARNHLQAVQAQLLLGEIVEQDVKPSRAGDVYRVDHAIRDPHRRAIDRRVRLDGRRSRRGCSGSRDGREQNKDYAAESHAFLLANSDRIGNTGLPAVGMNA